MDNKILQAKLLLALLIFLVVTAPVSANEIIRLNQFDNYLKQAQDLNTSGKPQQAQEALQEAKEQIHTPPCLLKLLKTEKLNKQKRKLKRWGN